MQLPDSFSTDWIVDHCDLRFDAGDAANGSLYLCTARGAPAPERALETLRASQLWSADAVKLVAEEQRDAYREGLKFVAAVALDRDGESLVLARFDHPKFPSDAGRFAAWQNALGVTVG